MVTPARDREALDQAVVRGSELLKQGKLGDAQRAFRQALDIDRRLDSWDLTLGKELWISDAAEDRLEEPIVTSSRVGISSATELMLRFFYEGNSFVSGKRTARK